MKIETIFDGCMLIVTIAMTILILWQLVMIAHMKKDHAIFARRKQRWTLICAVVYLGIGIVDIWLQKAIWFGMAFFLLGIANLLPLGGISKTVLYAGGRRIPLANSKTTLAQDKDLLVLTYESHIHYGYLCFALRERERIQKILEGTVLSGQ